MENVITVNIKREKATSIQQEISIPTIQGNVVDVICYTTKPERKVIEAVMWAIDKSELIEKIEDAGHRDIIINGMKWSISNCEFR